MKTESIWCGPSSAYKVVKHLTIVVCLILLLSACATSRAQRAQLNQDAAQPLTCSKGPDCEAKWAHGALNMDAGITPSPRYRSPTRRSSPHMLQSDPQLPQLFQLQKLKPSPEHTLFTFVPVVRGSLDFGVHQAYWSLKQVLPTMS